MLNPSSVFFSSVIALDWYFLIFSTSLLTFSLCLPTLLLSLVSIYMAITFNSLLGRLFVLILLRSFSGDLSWFATHSSVSSHCLTLCICLYTLSKRATSPSLEEVVFYRRWSVGPRSKYPLTTRARCSRVVPCVSCECLLPVAGLWLLCREGMAQFACPAQLCYSCCGMELVGHMVLTRSGCDLAAVQRGAWDTHWLSCSV